VSEQGQRLNIRKATLREWRQEFARRLREQGITANATERAVRGEARTYKLDGIYRADARGESTHSHARTAAVAAELVRGSLQVEPGKSKLMATRKEVERGWTATSDRLLAEGWRELALQARRFVSDMPPPRTEKEQLAAALLVRSRRVPERDLSPIR
jgi:hypothetical protein